MRARPLTLALIAAAGVCPVAFVAAAPAMTPEPLAVMQGLDKVTARVARFAAPVGDTVKFRDLSLIVRDCEKSAPEDRPENAAFVQIYENRPGEKPVRVFSGWMFSSSPALSALEHPVYDINLLQCEAARGSPAGDAAPPAAGVPAPAASGRSHGKTAR